MFVNLRVLGTILAHWLFEASQKKRKVALDT